jgi:single-strand DNA-binding protein
MSNTNHVIVTGNLTRAPELRTVGANSTPVCDFGLASNEKWKDGEHANFFDGEVWGQLGVVVNEYCDKGKAVLVEGSLRYESWEDKEGKKRSKVKIKAQRVEFIGKAVSETTRNPNDAEGGDDDDLPF